MSRSVASAVASLASLAALAAVVALGLGGGRVHADSTPPAAPAAPAALSAMRDGFDHYLHDRDIAVSGAEPVPCTQCHAMKSGLLVGVPGHADCFGTCHGPSPARATGTPLVIADDALRICLACHSAASLRSATPTRASLAPDYPPYARFQDFALEAPHQVHAAITCTSCHPQRDPGPRRSRRPAPDRARAPHQRCAGCHDGSATPGHATAMSACTQCHSPASGVPEPLAMVRTRDTQIFVTSTFSHGKHAARGGAGAECTSCHAAVRASNDRQLPRPPMLACGASGCHDGAAAFAVTGPCRKCHQDVPPGKFTVARPQTRFAHASPAHAGAGLACSACHTLSARGEPLPPTHAPCATCHATDFAARVPSTCGACHNGTEPWRRLEPDRARRDRTELGIAIDHTLHPGPCSRCHVANPVTGELALAPGHGACSGAGCHTAAGPVAPLITGCDGCHRLGLADARAAARAAATWSVRATFAHGAHARDAAGAAVPCATCHVDLTGPTPLELATPPKRTCAPCHDGTRAFKLTGTGCTRCHTRTASP